MIGAPDGQPELKSFIIKSYIIPDYTAKIKAATSVRSKVRRRLDEFDERRRMSVSCVLVVANVTAGLVEACLASKEQVLNVDTLDITSLENDELLRFDQKLEIGGESSSPASRLNDRRHVLIKVLRMVMPQTLCRLMYPRVDAPSLKMLLLKGWYLRVLMIPP